MPHSIHDHCSRVEIAHEALDPMGVPRVEVCGQPKIAVVCLGEDLVFGIESQDCEYGTEHFVAGEVAVVIDATENGGGHEPPMGQVTAET